MPSDRPTTLFDKLWSAHEILRRDDGEALLWVDRHYLHEGSFHAFDSLAQRKLSLAEPAVPVANLVRLVNSSESGEASA